MKIQFFAALREALAVSEIEWPVDTPLTIGELRQQLSEQSPQWHHALLTFGQMSAIDQQMAQDTDTVAPHQQVAFFPMVTGG